MLGGLMGRTVGVREASAEVVETDAVDSGETVDDTGAGQSGVGERGDGSGDRSGHSGGAAGETRRRRGSRELGEGRGEGGEGGREGMPVFVRINELPTTCHVMNENSSRKREVRTTTVGPEWDAKEEDPPLTTCTTM